MTMKSLFDINENTTADDIREALANGADVNARDYGDRTALNFTYNAEQARALLDAGADVNAQDKFGCTPLLVARNAGVTKTLLEAGADPKARTLFGHTSLHCAHNAEQTKALLEAGAEVSSDLDESHQEWVALGQTPSAMEGHGAEAAPTDGLSLTSPLATLLRKRARFGRERS